ncbi:MAG: hypothetical protein ACREFX_11365 [Opitutaceae bacterium]
MPALRRGSGHAGPDRAHTSTVGLTQATEPYLTHLISRGIEAALGELPGVAKGVNTREGTIACAAVARALGL